MNRLLTTATLAIALGAMSLSPAVAQAPSQTGPRMGMMGGGCPTMSMMGMMDQGMMGGQATMGRGAMMGGPARMGAMVDGRLAYLKGARTRVVSGKSVSVRVGLGGRRLLTKKTCNRSL